MRDSFVFYRSFFEATNALNKTQRTNVLLAICDYALNGTEPNLNGAAFAVFMLVRPQIDANNKKYANGKKGGRPVNSTDTEDEKNQDETKAKPNDNQEKPKPNDNQSETKAKPKDNQKITKGKPNVNENVNVNDNVNANANATATANAPGSGESGSGGRNNSSLEFWQKLSGEDIDAIYDAYPNTGGDLIEEVAKKVTRNKTDVQYPVSYILSYAKGVKWDDAADRGEAAAHCKAAGGSP